MKMDSTDQATPSGRPRRRIRFSPFVPALALALSCGAALAQDAGQVGETTVWLPENVSTFGGAIDKLFYFILYLTGVVGLAVFVVMGLFLYQYRYKPGRSATFIHGNNKLETVWTLVPTLIMALIAIFSQTTWSQIKTPFAQPTAQEVISGQKVEIGVIAKQFEWYFHYPGADGVLGQRKRELIDSAGGPPEQIGLDTTGAGADDFVIQQMVIPVDRPVYIHLTSRDVLHSFFLPNLRVKQDAVPGLVSKVWFEATKTSAEVIGTDPSFPLTVYVEGTGEVETITDARPFDIVCAELCGQGHFKMRGMMYVVTQQEYEQFIKLNSLNIAPSGDGDDGYGDGY